MSLDGLRAWIGEVERKLGMRTRVFIVLVAIAVGGAGGAIYLALDAQDEAVSKSDLESVRDELAGAAAAPATDGSVSQLEAEVKALQGEVATLRAAEGASGQGESKAPEVPTGGVTPGAASGGAPAPKSPKPLKESIERVEEEAKK
jgi:hypothetical protein